MVKICILAALISLVLSCSKKPKQCYKKLQSLSCDSTFLITNNFNSLENRYLAFAKLNGDEASFCLHSTTLSKKDNFVIGPLNANNLSGNVTGRPQRFGKTILINSSCQILLEEKIIEPDSLKMECLRASRSNDWPNKNKRVFRVKWDGGCELKQLESILAQIQQAKIEFLAYHSNDLFGLSICDLSELQMRELFDIQIDIVPMFSNKIKTSPPIFIPNAISPNSGG